MTTINSDNEVSISRARLDSITVYDVTEEELELIEAGSPSSLYLNFSIALLSICISLVVTLLVTEIKDTRVYLGFISACFISGIIGGILFVMWARTYKATKTVFAKIRSRKSPNAIREEADVQSAQSLAEIDPVDTAPQDSLLPKG